MSRKQVTMYVCMVGILFIMMGISQAAPMGTAFIYQGRLTDQGDPASGSYDIKFHLYDASSGGSLLGTETKNGMVLLDGYFDVELDFGDNVFTGEARWLEIEVAPGGSGIFTPLIPRQELTPTPYALYALNGSSGGGFWTDSGDHIYNTNSGNVGIGTINPIFELDVEGVIRSSNVGSCTGEVQLSGPDGSPGLIFLSNDPEGYRANIVRKRDGLGFGVHADTSNPGAEEMWISNSGNVGIGTSTPDAKLDVRGEIHTGNIEVRKNDIGNRYAYIDFHGDDTYTDYGLRLMRSNAGEDAYSRLAHRGNGQLQFMVEDAGMIRFYTNALGRMLIDSSGNVGIGTMTPGDKLQVGSGISLHDGGHKIIGFGYSPGTGNATYPGYPAGIRFDPAAGGLRIGTTADSIAEGDPVTGMSEKLRIDKDGNVGIGTTGPSAPLEIDKGVTANPSMMIRNSSYGSGDASGSVHIELGFRNHITKAIELNKVTTNTSELNLYSEYGFNVPALGLRIKADSSTPSLYIPGNVGIGTTSPGARLDVNGRTRTDVLEITGADLAEKFPVSEKVKPGMVVAIDPENPGQLCLARGAYNRCVAGVVSGANGLSVGAILGNLPGEENAPPIALSGRVWVYCDASKQPINPGDLLTTSMTAGHAMKVIDYSKSQGAILGKAMTSLAEGKGLVLVLISLQ